MSVNCILVDDENNAIDYASLSFIDSIGAVLVPFNIDTLGIYRKSQRLRFQVENEYEKVFDGEIISIEKGKIRLDDIRDLSSASPRKDVRVNVNINSCILYDSDDGYFSLSIRIRNISAGGMYFVCRSDLNMDKTYETIVDWIETPIIVRLKLLRKNLDKNNAFVYGCRFVDLLEEEERLLRAGVFYIQTKKFKLKGRNVNDAVC